jgi:hypothetical protein
MLFHLNFPSYTPFFKTDNLFFSTTGYYNEILTTLKLLCTQTPWIRARDNSPRTHQAPATPDNKSRNFLWDLGFA